MLKQFFNDTAIYSIAGILARGASFLLLPLYTPVLSPSDYGIYDIIGVFSSLAQVMIVLEISQAMYRYYPDTSIEVDKTGYASTALWFTIGSYAVFVVVGILLAQPLSTLILDTPDQAKLMRVALLSLWCGGVFSLLSLLLRCQMQAIAFAITSLGTTIATLLVSVFLVLVLRLGVIGVIAGNLAGNAVGVVLSVFFVRHNLRWRFDWTKLVEMLKFSIPLVPSSIGAFVAMYIDRIALKQIMSFTEVGLFGIGYRLVSPISLILISMASSLTPLIYANYRRPEAPWEIARIFQYSVALALLILLGISLFAREALILLTTPAYYAAADVVPFLALATLLAGMYIYTPGLGIAKKTGLIAIINILSAILNTVLNFALIPVLGIMGSAVATLLSTIVVFYLNMAYSQKYYPVPHNWKQLGLATLFTIGLVAVGRQVQSDLWLGICIKTVLVGIDIMLLYWLVLQRKLPVFSFPSR